MTARSSCYEEDMSRPWLFGSCALATLAAGCLDAGPTPLGRHLVTGRAPEQVQLVAGAVGAPRRLLLTRTMPPASQFVVSTLEYSTVDDPGPGGGASEARVIASGIGSPIAHCATPACPMIIDARGRLFLYRATFAPQPDLPGSIVEMDELVRVDPTTAEESNFGSTQSLQISADRTRVVFEESAPPTASAGQGQVFPPYIALDLDDEMTTLSATIAWFAGDDLYLVDTTNAVELLSRLPRGSRVLESTASDGVGSFSVYETGRGPLLVLTRYGDRAMNHPQLSAFFDATTRTEEPLPATTALAATFTLSADGRYVISMRPPQVNGIAIPDPSGTTTLTLLDRDTGQETVAVEPDQFVALPKWRPGRSEVWFDVMNTNLFRWQVGAEPEEVGPAVQFFGFPTLGMSSPQLLDTQGDPIFTPDGLFRIVVEGFQSERSPIDLQSADDATATPFVLNQPNMGLAGVWPLSDGRLVVENFLTDAEKNDVFVADPVARTQHRIATTGNVVATGHDRCLALLNWVATGGSGDLTIVDYATGAETLIAQNVHSVAVDASADANDALAPGTRVAFLVRNRIASPYDGLWVFELP
jgi:hypothetical protein